ncbi:MAG TPA: hypothetical protein VFE54_12895 [Mucilaginibacter sp.]|nr:hypothetical protein [Mucilaginibacter sp.]
MKKTIALAALILGLGTSVFAAVPAKLKAPKAEKVSFTSLKDDKGFGVSVEAGKSIVMFYDANNNVIFKDLLSKGGAAVKGYVVTGLEDGDYTVEVAANKSVVTKHIHVYDEGQKKSYIFVD